MDPQLERLQRANAALERWVRDLLMENRLLRDRLARTPPAEEGEEPAAVHRASRAA